MTKSRYRFNVTHVQTTNEDQIERNKHDQIRSKYLNSCKYFIAFLKVASLRIGIQQHNGIQPEPLWCKVYRVLLIGLAIRVAVSNVVTIMKVFNGLANGRIFYPIFYCDHLLFIIVIIHYWIRYHEIQTIIDDLLIKMRSLFEGAQLHRVFASTKTCSNLLVFIGILNWIVLCIVGIFQATLLHQQTNELILRDMYHLYVSKEYGTVMLLVLHVTFFFLVTNVYAFFGFVTLIIFMLFCCFKQLNIKLQSAEDTIGDLKEFQHFQNCHQQLAHLVDKTSNSVSPALFLIVMVKCSHIIFGINILQWGITHFDYFEARLVHISKALIIYLNAVGIILTLTLLGGKLQNEVRHLRTLMTYE